MAIEPGYVKAFRDGIRPPARTRAAVAVAPPSELAELVREVRAMRGELRALTTVVAGQAPPDLALIAELLPTIFAALGDRVFSAVDVAAAGVMHEALGRALAPMLGRDGGLRALGRAFARCAWQDINGFEVRRLGHSRDGALWQVVRVSNSQTHPAHCPTD